MVCNTNDTLLYLGEGVIKYIQIVASPFFLMLLSGYGTIVCQYPKITELLISVQLDLSDLLKPYVFGAYQL